MTRGTVLATLLLTAGAAASVAALGAFRPASAGAFAEAPPGLTAAEFERRLSAAAVAVRRSIESRPDVASVRVRVLSEAPDQPLLVSVRLAWRTTRGDLSVVAAEAHRAFNGIAEVRAEARDDGDGLVTFP